MTHVLAVDPGKMTGYAVWSTDIPRPVIGQDDFDSFLAFAERAARVRGPELVIVSEAYIVSMETVKKGRQGDAGDPYRQFSLEVIGALRYIAAKHGSEFAPLQRASEAKTVFSDARLRKLGWYEKGKEHGRDAARHLGLFLARNGLIDLATL